VPAEDARPLAELLVDQLEFANIIVLNKVGGWEEKGSSPDPQATVPRVDGGCQVGDAEADEVERLATLARQLNPSAEILRASHGQVPPERLFHRQLFDLHAAREAPGAGAALPLPTPHSPHWAPMARRVPQGGCRACKVRCGQKARSTV
jgi:G3E family GTPase